MSLRQKLLVPQLLIFAGLVTYLYGIWMPQALREAETTRLQLIARHLGTVEEALVPLILANRLDTIHDNLAALITKNTDWTSIRLLDSKSRTLFPEATAMSRTPPGPHRRTVERDIVYLGNTLGKLAVDLDLGPALSHDSKEHGDMVLLVLGFLGGILAVTMLTLELALRRPLRQLADASKALALQDFAAPLPPAGKDEMGGLINSFAGMRDALRDFQVKVLKEVGERRQAEEALRERETMYRSLVAAIAEGVVFCDAAGAITAINPAAERVISAVCADGEAAPEWLSLPGVREDGTLFPSECHPTAVTLRTGEPQNDVVMGLTKADGSTIWISINSQPLTRSDEAKPYAVATTFRDITALKQAEIDRHAHLRFLESLDRVNRAIQGTTSLEQMMSDVLDVTLEIFGCDRSCLVYPLDPEASVWHVPMARNRPEYAHLNTEKLIFNNPVMARDFRHLLAKGGPLKVGPEGDYPMPADEADNFGFRSVMSMPLFPKGEAAPWVFALMQYSYAKIWTPSETRLFVEITGRVSDALTSLLTYRNMRASEHKYHEIFDNVSDSLQLFDITPEGRFRFADMNPVAETFSGINKAEAVGRLFEEVMPPERAGNTLAQLRRCIETGAPVSYEEHVENPSRDLNTVLLPVHSDNGSIYRLIMFNRDVTNIKRVERQLSTLVENLPDFVARFDQDARYIFVSPAVEVASGIAAEDYIGRGIAEVGEPLSDENNWKLTHAIKTVFETAMPCSFEQKYSVPDDGEHTLELRFIPELDQNGKVISALSIWRDITERVQMTASLRQLSAAVEQSPGSIIITDTIGRIQYVNPAFCANTQYTAEEALGRSPAFLNGCDLSNENHAALWRTIRSGVVWHGTFNNQRKDGTRYWDEVTITPIRDATGAITQFVSIQQDITARKAAEERVEYLALHDNLTGLPNRLLGKDRMRQAMAFADRSECKAVLMFLDLDGFKRINDSLGHTVGDELLKGVGERLRACVRRTDAVARQGGDEFSIVLSGVRDAAVVVTVAATILEHINRPFVIEGHELSISASLGIAVYPDDGRDWDTLYKKADIAMYSAKDAGRNTYRYFTTQMNADADQVLKLRNKLQNALSRGELALYYQPVIDLKQGRISGVEALLRWHSPDLGVVPPNCFIPVAEDSGLIVPIGDWVLREACLQAMAWRKAGLPPMTMAVNLSAVQFRSHDLITSVRLALAESGLEPSCLELEMTESVLIKDTDQVLATLSQIEGLGASLSIDDFGTGFSGLSYLKRFDVDKVKIDQSFVRDMTTDANSAAIVDAIVQMARSLGLTTIAEGVNDELTLEALRQRGCDEAQGYYFAEPMPADQVPAFVRSFSETHDRFGIKRVICSSAS